MASITQTEFTTAPSLPKNATDVLLSDLEATNTKPLWAQMSKLNPPMPNPSTVPHVWRYDEIRPHLLRAGELITEKQAERRVLMLVNPARSKSDIPFN
jgi:gentisate 1,2-dioxygenase